MSKRQFERRHGHTHERTVANKAPILRLGDRRHRLVTPVIVTAEDAYTLTLTSGIVGCYGLGVRPRHQLCDTRCRPQIDELGEHISHPRQRIDKIQFTRLGPFRIRVSGRLKHFINAFGEEVIVENADKAIVNASANTGAVVNDYTAAPVYFGDNSNGAHEWLIEFEKEPENIAGFAAELDKSLKELNSDYEAKRHKDIALRLPIIKSVPIGLFNNWLRKKGKLGGQHKVPRLSNDRKYINELNQMLEEGIA